MTGVTMGTAAAGAGVTAAVLLRRRTGGAGGLPGGRVARNAEVARMASRVGRTYALSSARQVFASAERREQLKGELQLKTAAEVVEALGSMKGALMKLGQMASYLDTGLPEPMRQALASLQSDAPPMSAELAAGVVETEFGVPPDRLFAEWDPMPIAAASIGQVHRAMTHDGMAVAVKIQYPGVDDAIRSDLDNSAVLVQIVGMVFPGLEAEPVVEELRARLTEELDYQLEADNQQRFADGFAGHPFIHVPSVRADLSSRRVLTTELATGARYDEIVGWSESERNMAGETIFRFVFGSLYRYHAFNGDPHPGNYLFRPGGHVTFLDFGLVKWFAQNEVDLLAEMVDAMVVRRDVRAFRLAVEAAGFLKPDASLSDDVVATHLSHYYELVLEHGATSCTPEYATETGRRLFDATDAVVKRANVPPAFVVLQRINLGLYAVLAGIRATADWRRVAEEIWPWVGAEPSTGLGRQEAAWRSAEERTFRSRA